MTASPIASTDLIAADVAPEPDIAATTVAVDLDAVAQTAAFFIGTLLVVVVAKLLRDALAKRRGHSLSTLVVERDNVAVAVEMASFVLAVVIGVVGGLFVQGATWWEAGLDLLLTGGIVVAFLLAHDQLVTRVVLRGLDCNAAVAEESNLAVAIVRGSGDVAAALVLAGALGHASPLGERVIWALIGFVALTLLSLAYQALTRYDDVAEVRHKNVAAALPMAGVLLAVGIVVQAAVEGEGAGWGADLTSLSLDLIISAVLVLVLRWAGEKLFLPNASFHDEIVRDNNAGVGFIEAGITVSAALAVAYFLN